MQDFSQIKKRTHESTSTEQDQEERFEEEWDTTINYEN